MSKAYSRRAAPAGKATGPGRTDGRARGDIVDADAELIALISQLAIAMSEDALAESRYRQLRHTGDFEFSRANKFPRHKARWISEQWKVYEQDRISPKGRRASENAAFEAWNETAKRCFDLFDTIERMPARTITGVGAKALALAYASNHYGSGADGRPQYGERPAVGPAESILAFSRRDASAVLSRRAT